jgi:hypothetical protein
MKQNNTNVIAVGLSKTAVLLQAAILALASILPLAFFGTADAAQMTSRSATIDKSYINATDVQFIFGYSLPNTANTKAGIIYEFCTTPLGTCVLPTGMDVQTSNTHDAQSAWPTNGTAFAPVSEASNVGDCTVLTNSYMNCYSRDEAVATGTTGGAVTHTISGITAPSAIQSVYVRISVYSTDAFAPGDLLDEGTVAVAFVDQLTINGRVQERLDFCVAAIDDTDALPADVAACSALSDSNVDIGIITETGIAKSPVNITAANGADDDYGILMLNTNATTGAVVSYYAEEDAGGTEELRAFRVDNATCTPGGTSELDQCFVSTANSGSGTDLGTPGDEGFGLQIPCIDTSLGVTSALGSVPAWYDGDGTTTSAANCESTETSDIFGWNDSGTADTLASSTGVVDDEVIKLIFGAQAAPTTPSGNYTVVTTYIATVTF